MNATIIVDNEEGLLEFFAPEDKEIPRGSYTIEVDDKTNFNIQADDAVALRILTNAICKQLIIWEKTK